MTTERDADVETLRFVYQNALTQIEAAQERRRMLHAEFAALPTFAGAIVAVFFAARPDELPNVFAALYGVGVLVFVFLLYMCFGARNALDAPEVQEKIADEAQFSASLTDDDRLPLEAWLANSIVAWRAAAFAGLKIDTPYVAYLRRARITFGVLVVWLSSVAIAALVVGA
jgi:hypothetical protein